MSFVACPLIFGPFCMVAGAYNMEAHPMEAFFPREMLAELSSTSQQEAQPTAAPPAPPASSASDRRVRFALDGQAAQDANPQADTPPREEVRFEVWHHIQYAPWAPTPADARTESQCLGTYSALSEANKRAVLEVYEKYGGLAQQGGAAPSFPPNPNWLRNASDRSWPNTWKIEGGQLEFSLVISKLHSTLNGHIYIVKKTTTTTE
ncbi:hypothetical protein F5Y14DRAFT_417920 [Nemania sp. NC0429]|nr:hypothetical protein F5Y14DRAFT_417920 [Nemania sp. NC0429]